MLPKQPFRSSLRKLSQRWRRLHVKPAADRVVMAQAMGWLLILSIPLWLLGFRRTQLILLSLRPSLPHIQSFSAQQREIDQIVRLVNRTCRFFHVACLKRSLTLWWVLRWHGIDSAIRIGVRKVDQQLEAHAWVEWDGRILGERTSYVAQYQPFPADFAKPF
jgi:hypothetical protein